MKNLTNTELEFAGFLRDNHKGEINAITQRYISEWGTGPEVRKMVNRLRKAGFPICSGREGYFFAEKPEDLTGTIAQIASRVAELDMVLAALVKTQAKWRERNGK